MPRIILLIALFGFIDSATANNYAKEIKRYVIYPCVHASIIFIDANDAENFLDIHKATDVAVTSMADMSNNIITAVNRAIKELNIKRSDLKNRKTIYKFSLIECLKNLLFPEI